MRHIISLRLSKLARSRYRAYGLRRRRGAGQVCWCRAAQLGASVRPREADNDRVPISPAMMPSADAASGARAQGAHVPPTTYNYPPS